MYTLPEPTTVGNNQIKQVELIKATGVPVTKTYLYDGAKLTWYRYGYYFDPGYGRESNKKVNVIVEMENRADKHLGIALPKGKCRAYKKDADGALEFIGEDAIDHTARDERLALYIGDAFDVVGERKQTDFQKINDHECTESFEIKVRQPQEGGGHGQGAGEDVPQRRLGHYREVARLREARRADGRVPGEGRGGQGNDGDVHGALPLVSRLSFRVAPGTHDLRPSPSGTTSPGSFSARVVPFSEANTPGPGAAPRRPDSSPRQRRPRHTQLPHPVRGRRRRRARPRGSSSRRLACEGGRRVRSGMPWPPRLSGGSPHATAFRPGPSAPLAGNAAAAFVSRRPGLSADKPTPAELKEKVKTLVEQLADKDAGKQDEAAAGLIQLGPDALPSCPSPTPSSARSQKKALAVVRKTLRDQQIQRDLRPSSSPSTRS